MAGFVATQHRRRRTQRLRYSPAHPLEQRNRPTWSVIELVPRHWIAIRAIHRHPPSPLAQFKRKKYRATIAPLGVRTLESDVLG
jgi:hypothetical protein